MIADTSGPIIQNQFVQCKCVPNPIDDFYQPTVNRRNQWEKKWIIFLTRFHDYCAHFFYVICKPDKHLTLISEHELETEFILDFNWLQSLFYWYAVHRIFIRHHELTNESNFKLKQCSSSHQCISSVSTTRIDLHRIKQ